MLRYQGCHHPTLSLFLSGFLLLEGSSSPGCVWFQREQAILAHYENSISTEVFLGWGETQPMATQLNWWRPLSEEVEQCSVGLCACHYVFVSLSETLTITPSRGSILPLPLTLTQRQLEKRRRRHYLPQGWGTVQEDWARFLIKK